ncbi:hypothetical protein NQ315_003919 [Exocentrus adspersus]|uniref:Cyclin-dependent kinase inhibitor domain-containing protein n=1 Tax=Exocentrus adspersus TaxID=1586481 RepID=A0AAV8VYX0_9CUCU|nr:hypothetical protein NQ315_003919 [Exocentrus adspersus]
MSTSVYNPLELTLSSSMPETIFVCSREIRKVKRVLFEPPDQAATQKFVDEELEKIMLLQSEKWNFDFKREKTLNPNGIYQWRVATPQKTIRPVKIRPSDDIEDGIIQEELYGQLRDIDRPIESRVIEEEMKSPPKTTYKTRNQKKPQRLITVPGVKYFKSLSLLKAIQCPKKWTGVSSPSPHFGHKRGHKGLYAYQVEVPPKSALACQGCPSFGLEPFVQGLTARQS